MANRLVLIAALAKGKSVVRNLPKNHDIDVALAVAQGLGAKVYPLGTREEILREETSSSANPSHETVHTSEPDCPSAPIDLRNSSTDQMRSVIIEGVDGKIDVKNQTLYTADNGTLSRLVVPLVLLNDKPVTIQCSEQMAKRPMKDLFEAVETLGAKVESLGSEGCLPARIEGVFKGGEVSLSGDVSSQFFSALMLCAPYAKEKLILKATSQIVSKKYVDMTADVMSQWGACVREWDVEIGDNVANQQSKQAASSQNEKPTKLDSYQIEESDKGNTNTIVNGLAVEALTPVEQDAFVTSQKWHANQSLKKALPVYEVLPNQHYQAKDTVVEGDPSSASYFLAMAAIGLFRLKVFNYPVHSKQGEALFPLVLSAMGACVQVGDCDVDSAQSKYWLERGAEWESLTSGLDWLSGLRNGFDTKNGRFVEASREANPEANGGGVTKESNGLKGRPYSNKFSISKTSHDEEKLANRDDVSGETKADISPVKKIRPMGLGKQTSAREEKTTGLPKKTLPTSLDNDMSTHTVMVTPNLPLKGLDANMENMPDIVPTLMPLYPFVKREANAMSKEREKALAKIRGIGHLRHKESNRVEGIADQLKENGFEIIVKEDQMEMIDVPRIEKKKRLGQRGWDRRDGWWQTIFGKIG